MKKLCDSLKEENVIAGFKKCGIAPLNRNKVLSMLPQIIDDEENQNPENIQKNNEAVDNSFKELLQSLRQDQTPKIRKNRTKVNVKPGKSIGVEDFVDDDENLNPRTSLSSDQNLCSSKQVQPNKSRKRVELSSEDEDDFSVQDSDSSDSPDLDESTDRASGENLVINEHDYMLVKVYGKTKHLLDVIYARLLTLKTMVSLEHF